MPYDKLSSEVVQYLVFSELFTLTFVVLIHDTIYLIVPRNRHHLSSVIALRRWKLSPSILLSPSRRAVVTLLASPIVWVTRLNNSPGGENIIKFSGNPPKRLQTSIGSLKAWFSKSLIFGNGRICFFQDTYPLTFMDTFWWKISPPSEVILVYGLWVPVIGAAGRCYSDRKHEFLGPTNGGGEK